MMEKMENAFLFYLEIWRLHFGGNKATDLFSGVHEFFLSKKAMTYMKIIETGIEWENLETYKCTSAGYPRQNYLGS